MTKTASELAHLFRALKAPAAARALPALADRAREESWSYERFAEILLGTEVSARDSHGGESRIKAARFPARKTLEEFDFTFQRSVKKTIVENLGHDTVDGDDVYRLKVTLKNGDIIYYYLDPDTFLEIRTEKLQFIRGSVQETFSNLGSYKRVGGIYFPFSIERGTKQNPGDVSKITIDKIEANVPTQASEFKMPVSLPESSGRKEL
jgi:hypothetical protein